MEFLIVEDKKIEDLYPITLTRPGFDILCGGFTLYTLLKRYFPNCKIKYVVRPLVKDITKNKFMDEDVNEPIKILARTVPSVGNMEKIKKGDFNLDLIEFPHNVVIWNMKICKKNLEYMSKYLAKDKVFVGNNVKIHESVVFKSGPIIVDDDAEIMPFSYIEGPVYIGKKSIINPHSQIKNNVIIGETCKIGGEVEASIVQGFSNKQHCGFLGHSYVGEWVNIGAGTCNSDLKNTYGTIKVSGIQTNQIMLGCVMGDYCKTAINTSIFTGKIIGVNSFLYGFVDKDIPSFVNCMHGKFTEFWLEKAIEIQKKMYARRNRKQSKVDKKILEKIFDLTKNERKF